MCTNHVLRPFTAVPISRSLTSFGIFIAHPISSLALIPIVAAADRHCILRPFIFPPILVLPAFTTTFFLQHFLRQHKVIAYFFRPLAVLSHGSDLNYLGFSFMIGICRLALCIRWQRGAPSSGPRGMNRISSSSKTQSASGNIQRLLSECD